MKLERKRKKTNTPEAWKREHREQPMQKIKYISAPEVLPNLDHSLEPFEVFNIIAGIN